MTKQYEELFSQFSTLSGEDQLAKIREVRHRRSIERPAVARRRVVKEEKVKKVKGDKLRTMLTKMSPEQLAELKSALKSKGTE